MSQPNFKVLNGGLADNGPTPTHNHEAEAAVISCIVIDETPASWAIVRQCGVGAAAFHRAEHRVIFEAVAELFARGEGRVDLGMVRTQLIATGRLAEAGGNELLVSVATSQATTAQLRYYAELLKFLWDRRYCETLSAQLKNLGTHCDGDRAKWVSDVGAIGSRLITLGKRTLLKLVSDHAKDACADVRDRAEGRTDTSAWLYSSLPTFNSACKPYNSGIQDDGYVLIGGGSGKGKSVVLRQETYACCEAGGAALFISLETGTKGLLAMLAASHVGVDLNNLDTELKDRLADFYAELERMEREWTDKRLFILQREPATPLNDVEDVVEAIRCHVQRYGPPKLICIDYLQLLGTRERTNSREQEVARVSGQLQATQRELKRTMLVASQLNESGLKEMRVVKRDDKGRVIHRMPVPGDLRESQRMYHDCDRCIFLFCPTVDCYDREQISSGIQRPEIWWYQEKRRSGGVCFVRTWFEKKYTRFVELTREEILAGEGLESNKAAFTPPSNAAVPKSKSQFRGGENKMHAGPPY